MIQLNLPNQRKARIWLDELPDAVISAADSTSFTLPARNTARAGRKVAMEFSMPLARSPYGLLGGTFTPANTELLQVVILYELVHRHQIFASPFANEPERIYVGLPQVYADSVRKGVRLAPEWTEIAAGKLVIDRAAHSDIRSSEWVFTHLAIILMRLLQAPFEKLTDDEISSFFAEGIPSSNK